MAVALSGDVNLIALIETALAPLTGLPLWRQGEPLRRIPQAPSYQRAACAPGHAARSPSRMLPATVIDPS